MTMAKIIFNEDTDIPNLSGKVIFVTGGLQPSSKSVD